MGPTAPFPSHLQVPSEYVKSLFERPDLGGGCTSGLISFSKLVIVVVDDKDIKMIMMKMNTAL